MSNFFTFDQESRNVFQGEEEDSCLPALSFKERVYAFAVCFGLSVFIDFVSFGSMLGLITGNPVRYAMSFTLSNVLAIVGTGFLLGFKRQAKSAFDEKRRITAIVFLLAMVMTIVSVFVFQKPLLVLIFVVIQVCAYVWYMASYFPWGRDILKKCCKMCCRKCVGDQDS
jgi:hypothetical protein